MKLIQAFLNRAPPPGERSPPKEQENEAGSVLIVSVNKNKILYRPRTADPSTLTTDNLLTLANIITTSRLDHHCPPSLGVLTSVQITMLYLQENLRQQTLASIFGTSQPTISRAINNVLGVLDVVLPPPPRPKDLRSWGYTYLMARSCRVGGGRTLETYIAGNIIGQGTTFKF